MPVNLPPELQQANAYLQAGQKQAARTILVDFVRRQPNAELAWLMLSRVMDEPHQRADCLRQALRINPSNEDARCQIEALQAAPGSPSPRPAAPPPAAAPPASRPAASRPDWAPPAWEPPDWDASAQDPTSQSQPAHPSSQAEEVWEAPEWAPPWETPDWEKKRQETARRSQPDETPPASSAEPAWAAPAWDPSDWEVTPLETDTQAQPTGVHPSSSAGPAWTPPPAPIDLYSTQARTADKQPASGPADAPHNGLASRLEAGGGARQPAAEKSALPTLSESDLLSDKPAPSKSPRQQSKAGLSKGKIIGLVIFGLIVAALSCVAAFMAISSLLNSALAGEPVQPQVAAQLTLASQGQPALPVSATAAPGQAGFVLPPTWTPTPQPTATATPTITPTPAPSSTPTYQAPPATVAALMTRIEQEMADLRGLPIQQRPPRYLVSTVLVENMLKAELESSGGIEEIKNEARYLVALGLIKPTYDVVRYTMNGLVDGIGGFYRPDTKEIYVLGLQFRGMEHLTYAHEFDHALVDQQFNLEYLTEQALCATNTDRCIANRALVEGDATLAMMQWLKQYASPQDYRDLYNYRMPAQALPEQYPPDYVVHSLQFPYDQGLVFVSKLYEQGNWARVNQAYADPPISSEQILHPEKYLAREMPVALQDPSLELALGKPWRLIKSEVMGEFQTYLLLAYGADKAAQRKEDAAARAAAGWGGDQVQVFYNDETDQAILAAHWVWDTPEDAAEFELSMREYLDMLMRGARLERPYGYCWEANQKVNCLYIKGNDTLWLSTPDQASMDKVTLLFADIAAP